MKTFSKTERRAEERSLWTGKEEEKNGALWIRRMQKDDVPAVAALERQIFSQPWSENGFRTALESPDTLYLVAGAGKMLAGYCGLLQSFEEADITNVAVAQVWRRQGIAGNLLRQLMREGALRGIRRYTLEVRVTNDAALHLYRNLGFYSVGIRKNFYEKPKEDAVIMWTDWQEQP